MINWLRECGHLLRWDRAKGPWRGHLINLKTEINFNNIRHLCFLIFNFIWNEILQFICPRKSEGNKRKLLIKSSAIIQISTQSISSEVSRRTIEEKKGAKSTGERNIKLMNVSSVEQNWFLFIDPSNIDYFSSASMKCSIFFRSHLAWKEPFRLLLSDLNSGIEKSRINRKIVIFIAIKNIRRKKS